MSTFASGARILSAAAGVVLVGVAVPAAAHAAPQLSATEYVAASGVATNSDASCTTAGFSSVQAAVDAAATGGTVVVCTGIYDESVSITKALDLQGRSGAVINAAGGPYAVGIGADYVTVSGLTVEGAKASDQTHAPGDGIITAAFGANGPVAANHATIIGNHANNNEDAGIDLNSTRDSVAVDNTATKNGIGVNVVDDLDKPAAHNRVVGNTTSHNVSGCGVVLADHTGAGVFANLVEGNTANDNGTRSAKSAGAGVVIASPVKGGAVYDNTIRSNRLSGNGLAGVTLHAHLAGQRFSRNVIEDNVIGRNNTLKADYKDKNTTGIYIGGVSSLGVTVRDNVIRSNHFGVFVAGKDVHLHSSGNSYHGVAYQLVRIAKYAG